MYMAGIDFDPMKLYEPVSFPVSLKTPTISNIHRWDHSQTWPIPDDVQASLRGEGSGVSSGFIIDMADSSKYGYLQDHKVEGRPLFPGAGYILLVWQAFAKSNKKAYTETPILLEDVQFHATTILGEAGLYHVNVPSGFPLKPVPSELHVYSQTWLNVSRKSRKWYPIQGVTVFVMFT